MIQLPYEPKESRKWIEKELSKRYFKKPYDRFMWWRSYTPKNKPLDRKSSFRDKIANGDFDIGPYLWEVELAKHTMNDKYLNCVTTDGTPDHGKFTSESSIDRARIKRLNEDYEKDEKNKLEEIKKGFLLNLKMTKEQYEKEVINTGAKDLLTFYDRMSKKYGTNWKPLSYVGKT
tara:strand:+ start:241 stop:765 length:525 start_codon:yes stop_codon:yes gene_type:complete